jgi:hypothetical protein
MRALAFMLWESFGREMGRAKVAAAEVLSEGDALGNGA